MKEKTTDLLALNTKEQLLLHNLGTRKYWSERDKELAESASEQARHLKQTIPRFWKMTEGITLYEWQETCVQRWLENKRGTIKVVTGAGKTILALAIMERLQIEEPNLRVAIVVPTIVLQDQWYKEILDNGNLPAKTIGRLGGGYNDEFAGDVRILLCVLKSASDRLASLVHKSGVASKLLLVADECHRAGAPDMQKVFRADRAYNLGLSATPEREDYVDDSADVSSGYDTSLLGKELGPIVYEMTVHQALEQGVLPEFEIHHYGIPLQEPERDKYEKLSRRLRDVAGELSELGHQHGIHDRSITYRVQNLAKREDGLGLVARRYIALSGERKRLLYDANLRSKVVEEILAREFELDTSTRAILFHESIENVMHLYHQLLKKDFPVATEHSELPEGIRRESIEFFRKGTAQVLVSARTLIEGFNVPETDVGIIVASSTSIRQRIQTIGRLLRKGHHKDKTATIYILYVVDTVDETIYGKVDWNHLLGAKRNRYFLWSQDGVVNEQKQAPRSPLPSEESILQDALEIGNEYPGAYEGNEYSCDSDGNVFTSNRELILNPQGVPEQVRKAKGSLGRFKITQNKSYILVLTTEGDDWVVKFAGRLAEPFEIYAPRVSELVHQERVEKGLKQGDLLPHELVGTTTEVIFFKHSRGRNVLARRVARGEHFARVGELADDPKKGYDAERLLFICHEIRRTYPQLSKLLIIDSQYVVFLKEGRYHYLYTLTAGLDFS